MNIPVQSRNWKSKHPVQQWAHLPNQTNEECYVPDWRGWCYL